MITIDEAIERARKEAKKKMTEYENHYDRDAHYYPRQCKKCAEEHEQIAEWLEELKAYRMVYGTSFADVYNKAIGDFANALICDSEMYSDEMIKRIAEKLKVVVE